MSNNTEQTIQHIKTAAVAAGGAAVTASDINTYIQITLGLASLSYVCLQIYWGWVRHKRGSEK